MCGLPRTLVRQPGPGSSTGPATSAVTRACWMQRAGVYCGAGPQAEGQNLTHDQLLPAWFDRMRIVPLATLIAPADPDRRASPPGYS